MLSSTHAIYRGLQDSLRTSLSTLPDNAPPTLQLGLAQAHRKLSDYYNKIDDSQYYTWASRESDTGYRHLSFLYMTTAVLDPRIAYQGLLDDCEDDTSLRTHLEESKAKLEARYRADYAKRISAPVTAQSSTSSISTPRSPQKVDFTARYNKRMRHNTDEIDEFFKLLPESFAVDPIHWWAGRRAQFPNLSRLARDILSIPGML
jgi:hypothetical protein